MRTIMNHVVANDQALQLKITATDEPGSGGANHKYEISGFNQNNNPSMSGQPYAIGAPPCAILFQNGPLKEFGPNGISHEALIAVVMDRLHSFQSGPFACADNAEALEGLQKAMRALQRRTVARIMRGVEGTHQL